MSQHQSIFQVACRSIDGRNYIAFLDSNNNTRVMENAPSKLLCVELRDGRRIAFREDVACANDYIFLSCAAFGQSSDGQITIRGIEADAYKEYGPIRAFFENNLDDPSVEVNVSQSRSRRAPAP
jgi:hypothetical protein